MANDILLFPTLSDDFLKRIRFQKSKMEFYYTDQYGIQYELDDEPAEAMSSVNVVKDKNGVWNQDDYNIGLRRKYCLRTFNCLFGNEGIACSDAKLGLAIVWTSAESKQRGTINISTFSATDTIVESTVEYEFERAQLRGEINFTTVLYLAEAGNPSDEEQHLVNENGYILGNLDEYSVRLDGTGSSFPVFEVSESGQPLWYVKCDWTDPTEDLFEDCISINLNTAHKNYRYLDRKSSAFDSQLLAEIMASAITIIIEKARLQSVYWEQIINNENLNDGSVGQAIYYFTNTLNWDVSSPEIVSLCARKFFDQRM